MKRKSIGYIFWFQNVWRRWLFWIFWKSGWTHEIMLSKLKKKLMKSIFGLIAVHLLLLRLFLIEQLFSQQFMLTQCVTFVFNLTLRPYVTRASMPDKKPQRMQLKIRIDMRPPFLIYVKMYSDWWIVIFLYLFHSVIYHFPGRKSEFLLWFLNVKSFLTRTITVISLWSVLSNQFFWRSSSVDMPSIIPARKYILFWWWKMNIAYAVSNR